MTAILLTLLCLFGEYASLHVEGWLFNSGVNEVCFGKLGCFSDRPPFTNTPTYLPHSPEAVGTRFILYTRSNKNKPRELKMDGNSVILCTWSGFNRCLQTKIIIHGYHDHVDKEWVQEMVRELLKKDAFNVIVVDWKSGADEISYPQSAANIRLVGTQLAQLLIILQKVYGLKFESVHVIGHSLGAHVAGYAGSIIERIGRITGLDPAGPLFRQTDIDVRLDPSDALFVDVIHTDSENLYQLGFGLKEPVGTVDFYPNGGQNQPGCPSTYLDQWRLLLRGNFELVQNFGCSHLRSYIYFTESINSKCEFLSYPCENVTMSDGYKSCDTCGDKGCARMGFHANPETSSGLYYLPTNSTEPFCAN